MSSDGPSGQQQQQSSSGGHAVYRNRDDSSADSDSSGSSVGLAAPAAGRGRRPAPAEEEDNVEQVSPPALKRARTTNEDRWAGRWGGLITAPGRESTRPLAVSAHPQLGAISGLDLTVGRDLLVPQCGRGAA